MRLHKVVRCRRWAPISRDGDREPRSLLTKLEEMIDALAHWLSQESEKDRRRVAIGALATMLGSIVLARATADKALSNDILEAGRWAVRDQTTSRNQRLAA